MRAPTLQLCESPADGSGVAQEEAIEQLDAALTRFMLAKARFEKERGVIVIPEPQRRWTGEESARAVR